jgi:hypothetical protein
MVENLYLHIGTPKTGTTSIQRFLRENQASLRAKNIYYPSAVFRHPKIALYAQHISKISKQNRVVNIGFGIKDPDTLATFKETFRDELKAELKPLPAETTVILSNELCYSRLTSVEELQELRALLEAVSNAIKIVVYIRRQDLTKISHFSTQIKRGLTKNLYFSKDEIESLLNYEEKIELWSSIFGEDNIIVKLFDRREMLDGDIVSDFANIFNITNLDSFVLPARTNESLGSEQLDFLRRMNLFLPMIHNGEVNPLRGDIVKLLERQQQSGEPLARIYQNDLVKFSGLYEESNNSVSTKYFNGAPLFPPENKKELRGNSLELDQEQRQELLTRVNFNSSDADIICSSFLVFSELWKEKQATEIANKEKIAHQREIIAQLRKKVAEEGSMTARTLRSVALRIRRLIKKIVATN